MSTINAQIIICCSSLSEDFYRRFFSKNGVNKEMVFFNRTWVVVFGVVGAVIASDQTSSVLGLVARAWAGLGASIGPVILFSLFWKKVTKIAAVVGVVSGSLGAIIFSKMSFISYEILPAFLLSSLLIYVVSLMTQSQVPANVERDFAKLKSLHE
jgi:sodium/proline symporter